MNIVALSGRIATDLELLRKGDKSYCKFNLAVSKPSAKNGANFIPCIAWGTTAELILKYTTKGNRISLHGSIEVTNKDKHLYQNVVIGKIYFIDGKKDILKEIGDDDDIEY